MIKLMKNITLLILMFFSLTLQAESLDYYLELAAKNNPALKAKYAEFQASLEKVTQVNSLPDPTLSFGYFVMPVETRIGPQNAKIGLSQMFPWFGTLKAKGEVHTLLAEAKYQAFLDLKNQIFKSVKIAWYELYEVNRMIHLQMENQSILESFKVLSESAFKNGKGSMVDVIRIDIQLEDVQQNIAILRLKLEPIKMKFNALLNRSKDAPIIAPSNLNFKAVEAEYRKDSLTLHPQLEAFDFKIQSSQKQLEVAKKMGMPKLGVGLDYVMVGERKDMNVENSGRDVIMPMVSLTLPINRAKYRAQAKEASLYQTQLEMSKQNFENHLKSAYEQAWFKAEKNRQLIDLYQSQIEKTNQAIQLLLKAYSTSGKDFEEILRMQQVLLKYQMEEVIAKKSYFMAIAEIDYLSAKN